VHGTKRELNFEKLKSAPTRTNNQYFSPTGTNDRINKIRVEQHLNRVDHEKYYFYHQNGNTLSDGYYTTRKARS
jgi:hypothetical protein